ncbi:hypothetical protein B296_00013650 [Ensete ventricosum]|uniref:Helicase ATP-binding domain-containing protein n=1 Tax=Ensete ventricosum TaxID=4639 RepID=A0A427B8B7_ENSVE|nr:hypothetical protein B296_00013650 [Ensete ventricosum]
MVLAPTRELARQVEKEFKESSKLYTLCVYGGSPISQQMRALDYGVDVVVGTPGRIIDLLNRGALNLSEIQFVVLDEADQMLNVGFAEDVERILEKMPPKRGYDGDKDAKGGSIREDDHDDDELPRITVEGGGEDMIGSMRGGRFDLYGSGRMGSSGFGRGGNYGRSRGFGDSGGRTGGFGESGSGRFGSFGGSASGAPSRSGGSNFGRSDGFGNFSSGRSGGLGDSGAGHFGNFGSSGSVGSFGNSDSSRSSISNGSSPSCSSGYGGSSRSSSFGSFGGGSSKDDGDDGWPGRSFMSSS